MLEFEKRFILVRIKIKAQRRGFRTDPFLLLSSVFNLGSNIKALTTSGHPALTPSGLTPPRKSDFIKWLISANVFNMNTVRTTPLLFISFSMKNEWRRGGDSNPRDGDHQQVSSLPP